MRPVDKLFWLQKVLFYMIRYPAYSDDYIKRQIESQATQVHKDEIARYSEFSASRRHFMLELMAIYAIVGLKNFYFVYYTMTNVDFINPEANIKPTGGDGEFAYACLVSNCSKYIETKYNTTISLASGLTKLPIFVICKQEYKWYYNPTVGSQEIALILNSGLAFAAFATCILTQIYQYSIPSTPNTTAMFCTCPMIELNRTRRKIGLTLEKLSFSLENFTMNKALRPFERMSFGRGTPYFMTNNTNFMTTKAFMNCSENKEMGQIMLNSSICQIGLDDYLPINRTQWWRKKWTLLVTTVCMALFVTFWLIIGTIVLSFAYYAQHIFSREQSDFLDSLHGANCSLWYNNFEDLNGTRVVSYFDLEHIENPWNWFTISELILEMFVPIYVVAAILGTFLFICIEMRVCIIELTILLNIAIDLVELDCAKMIKTNIKNRKVFKFKKIQSSPFSLDKCYLHGPKTKSYAKIDIKITPVDEMSWLAPIILDRLIKMINFDWPVLLITPVDKFGQLVRGKLGAHLVNQEFALDLLHLASVNSKQGNNEAEFTTNLLVKLLEKIHANYRTLVDLLAEHNPGLINVLLICCVCDYGYSFMGVYFYRNVENFRQVALIFIITVLMIATLFISNFSSIHADLRKLDHKFWCIVARTTNYGDVRIQHFRCIWQKNLNLVAADGGLAVKIGKISITYVRILQLTLGTATIFALSLNRY